MIENHPAIAYAGFLSVGIAYTLQVVCQKRCPPAPASIIMSLEAVFAALAGYLVLNQILTGRAIIGCFLILAGVLMVQLLPLMRRARDERPSKQHETRMGLSVDRAIWRGAWRLVTRSVP